MPNVGTKLQPDEIAVSAGKVSVPAGTTCREAAEAAAEMFDTSEIEKHAEVIGEAWKTKLLEYSRTYIKQLAALTRAAQTNGNGETKEAAEPISFFLGIPYQWWNLMLAGPFQPVAPLGPFAPQKIIRHGEPAFLLAAFWRNPAPLPFGPNPSAAQIMSPYTCRLRLEGINLSDVANGPDFVDTFAFGPGNINIRAIVLPTAAFTPPTDGNPKLWEFNATADILGQGPGLPPFAGFATAVYDPDIEPPFLFPFIPGIGPVLVPGLAAQLQRDIPLRLLRYV